MTPITIFKGRRVAVFGLGASGNSAAKALIAGGADVAAWDDSEKGREGALKAGLPLEDLSTVDWSAFAALVLAPGVPLTHPKPNWTVEKAKAQGIEVIGDIELFMRERAKVAPDSSLVAITGTNGKSTTTALTGHIFSTASRDTQVGGNLGTPILALAPPTPERVHVIEMSSYQIDLTPSLKVTAGIMLNVSPDHIDRHGTLENYARIKARVPASAEFPIVGVDDDFGRAFAEQIEPTRKVIRISTKGLVPSGYVAGETHLYRVSGGAGEEVADLAGIGSLRGKHNAQNALAAFAACSSLGLSDETIRNGLRSFPGLAHRMEEVGRRGHVLFVNDSKATNADSTEKALSSFDNIFWIAGGRPKEGGIVPLANFFPKIRKAYLIGEAAADFARTLDGRVAYDRAETLDRATAAAARDAAASGLKDAVVLLSPACASFDQFPNFEVRGNTFRDLVKRLP